MPNRSSAGSLLAAVAIAGLNMRTVFASLPPLLQQVRADLGLSAAVAGLLTTGPVVCFGLFAPLAPRLARRTGIERLLVVAATLTAAGTAARGVGGMAGLFAGTIVAGAAIAVAQTLVPILIRLRFPVRAGALTGAFSMALTLGSAAAAGLAVPLAHAFAGWRMALAVFAVPTALSAFAWLAPAAPGRTRLPAADRPALRRSGGSWSIALFFGAQSMAFYSALTWLPTILQAHGYSAGQAGGLLALGNAVQFGPAFLTPVVAARRESQTALLLIVAAVACGSLAGLLLVPRLAPLWMVMLGAAQGGALGLALMLPVLRGATGPAVAALTAMALSVGYLLASIGPTLIGVVHDATNGWTVPLLLLLAISASELVGIPATRAWKLGD